MSKGNIIDSIVQGYAKHGPNPLFTALLLGLGSYGVGRLGWKSTVETLRSLGRPLGRKLLSTGSDARSLAEADDNWNTAMDNLKQDSHLARWVPVGIGALTTGLALEVFRNPKQPHQGLLKWYPKTASFNDAPYIRTQEMGMDPYVTELDWNRRIPAADVVGLFKNDPHLDDQMYARNMGISIVSDASINNHTRNPSLGNIFDSAVNKIENKLTFGGLTNVALKTAVANGVSRLFANSVGAMMDLSPKARQNLVDAGTWAGAVTSMLQ